MESESDGKEKGILNYFFFGIQEKYRKKKGEINNKPALEKILKSAGYNIAGGAETTAFRILPVITSAMALYGARIYDYKLAGNAAIATALLIGIDIYRYMKK